MKKYFVLFTCGLLALWHVGATALYLMPTNPLTATYYPFVARYMTPLFSQNWGLFAPEPATSSLNLLYRCKLVQGDQMSWQPWQDVLSPLYREHHAFPFTYRGKLSYIYQGLVRDLFNEAIKDNNAFYVKNGVSTSKMTAKNTQTKSFNSLAQAVHDLCRMQSVSSLKSFEFQIVRTYAPDFSKRLVSKQGRIETMEFPIVTLKSPSKGGSYAHAK